MQPSTETSVFTREEFMQAIGEVFYPYAFAQQTRIKANGCRFTYYTTAATAMLLFQKRKLWLRNTQVMNDYSEVDHGIECIVKARKSEAGASLNHALNQIFDGVAEEIWNTFFAWAPGTRRDTYVACFSEHSQDEDQYGRLSMWRAYGGNAGIAIVINGGVMMRPSDALSAYSSPVAYREFEAIKEEMSAVAANLSARPEVARALGREGLRAHMVDVLRFAAVCTKHPAFAEEREWRVIAQPSLRMSKHVALEYETIGGVPQPVLKLNLADVPEEGLTGLSPDELVDRVLIGPCEHAGVIFPALVSAMEVAGIRDAATRVRITNIPLRPNQR